MEQLICYFPICTNKNDVFIEEKPLWVATLNDGTVVYQDDERPGEFSSAWLRLKQNCALSNRWIIRLHLQFRSNIIHPLPENCRGYFFSKKLIQFVGGKKFDFYLIGHVLDNKDLVVVRTFKVPELIELQVETRSLIDYPDNIIIRS
jgi:hypothetical protein